MVSPNYNFFWILAHYAFENISKKPWFFALICNSNKHYILKFFSHFRPLWIVAHHMLARSASPTTSRLDENPFFALLIPQQRHHGLPKTQEQHLTIELPPPPHPRGNGVWRRQSPFMCLCSAAELAWTVGIAMEIIEVAASVKKYFSSFPYKI